MKINVTKPSLPPFEEYCEEIKKIWEKVHLTNNGPLLLEFQNRLATFLNVENISLFVNGHSALEAAIEIFDFPSGSEIITTPFTFASTTNAIIRKGLQPIFCDISSEDFTIDTDKIEKLITKKTVAILAVHVFGNPCDVQKIDKIAKKYNLKVIYDAAHAFGVECHGINVCNYGDVSMLSFHATKVFHTIEGGAVCYKNKSYSKKFDLIKNFGLLDEQCAYCGGNFKMNEFQAAMGLCNLSHLSEYVEKRKQIFNRYVSNFKGVFGISTLKLNDDCLPNYSYFTILLNGFKKSRDQIIEELMSNDIGARKYFYPATNEFTYLNEGSKTPIAHFVSQNIIALPIYDSLSLEEVDQICKIIKN